MSRRSDTQKRNWARYHIVESGTVVTVRDGVINFAIPGQWRVVGWWQFLRKKKGWGEMTRKGFKTTGV